MSLWSLLPKRKPKFFLVEDKYRVVEAFKLNGVKYYCFDDAFKTPSARAMRALIVYEEFNMRCTADYLKKHTRAMEILLNDPKQIKVGEIALLNKNLKERLNMAPFPEYIYKLASVVFFDKHESIWEYDSAYNEKKIAEWKKDEKALGFFLSKPLQALMPHLELQPSSLEMFSQVSEQVDKLHLQDLQEVLSNSK